MPDKPENSEPARIVHLGLGAFFRAHVATYLADLGGWGVIGVSLRSPSVRDALKPQGCTYTAIELAPDRPKPRRMTLIRDVLVAPEDPKAVIHAMARPEVSVVSLTVTEKGYCSDPATGKLNPDHPDIQHDISSDLPRSAPGFIVRALAARRAAGVPAFTVLCCDNLPNNGQVTQRIVTALAQRIDPELAAWITQNAAFPSSMVDRIVPATTPQDIALAKDLTGQPDAAPVMHEPFRQWVLEDSFVADRPALETVGVQMVRDVTSFEHMKLRMLNGAHSALSYLGYLAGHRTVAAATADPVVVRYLHHLWQTEIIPTLQTPPDTDLKAYADTLLSRFQNPAISHSTYQIAMDGSQKLPQRLLDTIRDRAELDKPALLLAVAGWMRYVTGSDDQGNPITVQDPLADDLRAAASDDPTRTVAALLSDTRIFAPAIAANIAEPILPLFQGLVERGARAMMQEVAR